MWERAIQMVYSCSEDINFDRVCSLSWSMGAWGIRGMLNTMGVRSTH